MKFVTAALGILSIVLMLMIPSLAFAQDMAAPDAAIVESVELASGLLSGGQETSQAVRIIVMLTALSFLPAVILVMTPFTRFIIVFSLLRQALGLQQTPPNQVLVGLSLFLSLLVMAPQVKEINENAVEPYLAGQMETGDAIDSALVPLRGFMLANTQKQEMGTVLNIARIERPESLEDIPTPVVVSAYVLSELETAFIIAVKVYIPFLVIDLVVASVLLGMGMMVLPPVVISLPFKLLVFVLMDGWGLLITNMIVSFQ